MPNLLTPKKGTNRLLQVRPVFHAAYLYVFAFIAIIIGIQYVATHAAGYPAVLTINMSADSGTLTPTNYAFGAINHDIGICYGVTRGWQWSNGNNVCDGNQIGEAAQPTWLVAPSVSGYTFQSWGGNCSAVSGNECEMNVPAYSSQSVTAYYHNNSYVPPPTPATAPTLSVSGKSTTTVSLAWSSGTAASNGSISQYLVHADNKTVATLGASTLAYQAGGFACGTSHSFYITMNYGSGSINSNTVSATTSACPTPAPTPKPTPKPSTPAPSTPAPGSGTNGGKGATASSTPPPTAGDTTPPTTPTNFVATQTGSSVVVNLQWTASTDTDTGVKYYNVDRSVDNVTWTNLHVGITTTSYTDTTTQFGVHYYYRVAALDNANNVSGYATADLTTASFQSTASQSSGQTLLSSDDILTVAIPTGATTQDVACSLQDGSVTSSKLIAGPYQLVCKDSSGADINSFNSSITWSYKLPSSLTKKYGTIQAVSYDQNGKTTVAASKFDRKTSTIIFASMNGVQGGVLGTIHHSYWGLIFEILFIVAAVLGGVYYVGLRRLHAQNYDDYLRRKYTDL